MKIPYNVYRSIAATAKRGAEFLDKKVPGWHDRINVGVLQMTSSCFCIYGQLNAVSLLNDVKRCYANGDSNDQHFGYLIPAAAKTWLSNSAHFNTEYDDRHDAAWNALQEEWLRQIYLRREAKVAV